MIRRKLNETNSSIIHNITESYHNTGTISKNNITKLYKNLFEDVKTVNTIFIHPEYNDNFNDWWSVYELFEEVKFKDGEVHYFLTEARGDKLLVEEVRFSEEMLSHKEYC